MKFTFYNFVSLSQYLTFKIPNLLFQRIGNLPIRLLRRVATMFDGDSNPLRTAINPNVPKMFIVDALKGVCFKSMSLLSLLF